MNVISVHMIEKIKVQFKKQIFGDDFVKKGMKVWLTDIQWIDEEGCYKLWFDFKDFEKENDAYFKEMYYSNNHTRDFPEKPLYTAKEAGYYKEKYAVYFSLTLSDKREDELFEEEIIDYLRVIQ